MADLYGASEGALRSTNQVPFGLQAGQLLVIPLHPVDGGEILPLRVIYTTETVTMETLAQRYGTDPGTIEAYNGLGNQNSVPVGRWLVIPVVP